MNIADLKDLHYKGSEAELDDAVEEFCEQYASYDEFYEAEYSGSRVPAVRC